MRNLKLTRNTKKRYRRTREEMKRTIEAVQKLSATKKPKEIAAELGLTYSNVLNIKNNPHYGVAAPARKYYRNRGKEASGEFFDVDAYARNNFY